MECVDLSISKGKRRIFPPPVALRMKCEEFTFLKMVDSIALQQSLRDLDRGFMNFFQKRAAYPIFKSKHNRHQSYRTIVKSNVKGWCPMTVKEYNELYQKIGTCKVAICKMDEAIQDNNLVRLKSLIPDYFEELVSKSLEVYVEYNRQKIQNDSINESSDEELLHQCIQISMTIQEEYLKNPQDFSKQKELNDKIISLEKQILNRMKNRYVSAANHSCCDTLT